MTDRPIIFSAPMVRALLDGRKTQTRRILKKPGWAQDKGWPESIMNEMDLDGRLVWYDKDTGCAAALPLAKPSDRLWVRENWRVGAWLHHERAIAVDYPADDFARKEWLDVADLNQHTRLVEQSRADAEKAGLIKSGAEFEYRWSPGDSPCRTRPSIHMPRWASRLTLNVTDVRVERLQIISRGDAMQEGCPHPNMQDGPNPVDWFRGVWSDINGPGAWDQNPWVVAYTFTVKKRNIDQCA